MASSTLQPSMPSAHQDDWINMLAGMDQFLDEVTDSIPLNSPTLGPIATGQSAPSDLQILPPAITPPPTIKHVESPIEFDSRTSPSGQESSERPTEVFSAPKAVECIKDNISAEAKAQARSERKRTREKQRRLDVNSQIVDLTTLLLKVEADEAEASGESLKCKSTTSPSNRVELISRTIAALSKVHTENKKRGRELVDLKSKLGDMRKMKDAAEQEARQRSQPPVNLQANPQPQKQQSMLMMVPMMVGADGNFMPQAMQMPMQMQVCPQAMYQNQQAPNAVYPSIAQPKPQVMYYPNTPAPAPSVPQVPTVQAPVPLQQQTVPLKQTFMVDKTQKQQDKRLGQGYNTVSFDSSQMNLNVGGNLAHCA